MAIAQGRNGYVTFGGTKYPFFNWNIRSGRNLVAPVPVGNTWGTNFAEGLQTSLFTGNVMLREKATECLASGFWDYWLTRAWSGGFDDTSTFSLVGSSGKKTYTLANCKAESFVITGAPGAPIGLQVAVVAPGIPTIADVTPAAYAPVDNSPPLMFDKVSFGGITGAVYGFELTFANNHMPNAPLNGTKTATGFDAGVITAGLSLTIDARAVASEPFSDGSSLTISLAGGVTRIFTLQSVIPANPRDPDVNIGQVFQTYQCLVQGSTSQPPLRYS